MAAFPEPRIAVVPEHVRSAGPQLAGLARLGGVVLDGAQLFVADATTGVGADGKWAAFESVVFAPRQTIKTEFALARILGGLFLFGEDYIAYSAHQARTTTRVFRRLKRIIDRSPELGGRVARVSNRVGSETLELDTGQAVECVARSTSTGRGLTGSTVILDESHELDGDALAALLPMLATRPNPSVLYLLSLGNEHSSHVGGLRARALNGDPGVCWVEWSMADGDDVADPAVWLRCNPGSPERISLEYMAKEYAALGPERFARERLGQSTWPSGESGEWEVIGQAAWDACSRPSPGSPAVVAVEPVQDPEPEPGPFDPFRKWPEGLPPWVRRRGEVRSLVG